MYHDREKIGNQLTNEISPIGPNETKNENPEINVQPEIILVIQFLHLGGNFAKAVSAKSKTV